MERFTSGNSAEAHGFSRGRKRVPSVRQSIGYATADSPFMFKKFNKEWILL
jgi:hypothetical protein